MTDFESGCVHQAVAASVWLSRHRRLRPEKMVRSAVLAASAGRWVPFAPPPEASDEPASVRCPAVWHLAPPTYLPSFPLALTLLGAVALGEGHWQLHARMSGPGGVQALSGLASLRAPDAGSRLLTADLAQDSACAARCPGRVMLTARLVAPPAQSASEGRLCW